MNWQAFALTARLAALTSFLLLVIGLPVALWLAFSPRRWKFLLESAVGMPLVLPPPLA